MQHIPIYLYDNNITLLYSNAGVPNRGDKVYQRDLKAYKGVDNAIKLQVKNNDQKKVDMSSKNLQFNIVDRANRVNYVTKTAENINATSGVFEIVLSDNDLRDLSAQWYNYSITVIGEAGDKSVAYVDDAFEAKGNIQIIDAVYPDFAESNEMRLINGTEYTSAVDARADLNKNPALHTAQVKFDTIFSGTITAQASMNTSFSQDNDEFFDVHTTNYSNQSVTDYFNFTGVYAQVRFRVEADAGSVDTILYRS